MGEHDLHISATVALIEWDGQHLVRHRSICRKRSVGQRPVNGAKHLSLHQKSPQAVAQTSPYQDREAQGDLSDRERIEERPNAVLRV